MERWDSYLRKFVTVQEGGPGSGNFGHGGRPGEVGGSGGGGPRETTGTPIGNVKLKPDSVREKVRSEIRSLISRSSGVHDVHTRSTMLKKAKHEVMAAGATGHLSKEESENLLNQID